MHPYLTPTERTILEIESKTWRFEGVKESVVWSKLDMSLTRYYGRLNRMLDDPRIEAASPVVTHRLQRIRESRQRSRRIA